MVVGIMKGVMTPRQQHVLGLLDQWATTRNGGLPLRLVANEYFARSHDLPPTQRLQVMKQANHLMRWKCLLDALSHQSLGGTWKTRYYSYTRYGEKGLRGYIDHKGIEMHVRYGFPPELFLMLKQCYDSATLKQICTASNSDAIPTLRVNPLKGLNRDEVIRVLREQDKSALVSCTSRSRDGIYFDSVSMAPQWLPCFSEGHFEVQDESLQVVAGLVRPKLGETVLHLNAGTGGQALAIASTMQNKGVVYLVNEAGGKESLKIARDRFKRGGCFNAQFVERAAALKNVKAHWILVSAKSTSTGTYRRNPDSKWHFSEALLRDSVEDQRRVMDLALLHLRDDGHIVYATQSLLPLENESQVAYFVKRHNLKIVGSPLKLLPSVNGMDGAFAVTLARA